MTRIVFIALSLYTHLMRALNAAAICFLFMLACVKSDSHAGSRTDHWSGFDIGAGEPFPSLYGIMVGFNIQDDARISFGAGRFVRWTTYELDAKFFLAPTDLAGYIGGGLVYLDGKRGSVGAWNLKFDRAFVPYIEGGLDYQFKDGLHFNLNLAASAPNGQVLILPGLAVGWYF